MVLCSDRNDRIANRNRFFEAVRGMGSALDITDSHPTSQDCRRKLKNMV